jgi:4-amino-4-deoxy-L-arabinose transferase-like glycosyltransferase
MSAPVAVEDPAESPRLLSSVIPVTLLFSLAAAFRLVWWHVGPRVIESEGVYYARVGENIAVGRGLVGIHEMGLQLLDPPMYATLIALGVRLGFNSEVAGRGISLIAGAGLPVVAFLIARRLYGQAAGWLAGVLAAVHPLLIAISVAVLTESFYLTVSLLAVYCMIDVFALATRRSAILAGVYLGLAYLCRPEALILTGLLGATVVLANRSRWRLAVARVSVLVGTFAIFAIPYIAFLSAETGQLRWEAKTADGVRWALRSEAGQSWGEIYFGISPDLLETGASNTSDLAMLQTTQISVGHRARIIARQAVENFPRLLRAVGDVQLGAPMIGILAALGLFATAWNRTRLNGEWPLLVITGLTLLTFCTWPFFHDRFMFPLLGPQVIWAGAGLDGLRRWTRDTSIALDLSPLSARFLAVCLMGSSVAVVCAASAVGTRRSDELSQGWSALADDIPVGQWLRTQDRTPRLMDTEPTVAYYAGAVLVPYPWTDGTNALRYIERKQIKYLIFRDTDTDRRPYLTAWLLHIPDGRLELLKTFQGASGAIRVYRWRGMAD